MGYLIRPVEPGRSAYHRGLRQLPLTTEVVLSHRHVGLIGRQEVINGISQNRMDLTRFAKEILSMLEASDTASCGRFSW